MTQDTASETMAAFVARLEITFTAVKVRGPLSRNTDKWEDGANEWRITMRRNGKVLEVPYWTGTGIKTTPTAVDVLDCLASDASMGTDSFDRWCADMGYDTDSRKALDTYLDCQSIGNQLRALLGSHKEYENLLYSVERP